MKSTPPSSGTAQSLASRLIREAQQRSGLSLREIGRRAGTSHATLSAYLNMHKSPATSTLERILEACDVALDV
ncbi:MAG: helix-turn-helix transcriptional regulator, partial [Pseudomonadota bacterium]